MRLVRLGTLIDLRSLTEHYGIVGIQIWSPQIHDFVQWLLHNCSNWDFRASYMVSGCLVAAASPADFFFKEQDMKGPCFLSCLLLMEFKAGDNIVVA